MDSLASEKIPAGISRFMFLLGKMRHFNALLRLRQKTFFSSAFVFIFCATSTRRRTSLMSNFSGSSLLNELFPKFIDPNPKPAGLPFLSACARAKKVSKNATKSCSEMKLCYFLASKSEQIWSWSQQRDQSFFYLLYLIGSCREAKKIKTANFAFRKDLSTLRSDGQI